MCMSPPRTGRDKDVQHSREELLETELGATGFDCRRLYRTGKSRNEMQRVPRGEMKEAAEEKLTE